MSGTGEYLTLRSRAIRAREATLESVRVARHQQLAELFVAVRDKPRYTEFEAGLSGRKRRRLVDGKHSQDVEPPLEGLEAFEKEYAKPDSLARLDVSLPPHVVDAKSGSTQPGDSNAPPPPLLADSLANPVAIVEDSEEDAEGEADDEIPPAASAVAQYAADAASSAPSLAPAGAPSAPQIALTAPSASPSAAPSPRASSANATPQPTTVSPAALMTAGPSNPAPTPAVADFPHAPLSIPTYESEFGIHEVSSDYIEALPPVPADTLRTRFNSAASLRASTKKAARSSAVQQVQPDLYKLHVRAQLMSAKFFLGPGKRVHNVLSTSQWETGIDEMRAIRAFERIEELKADKKWSFRQPKKQRTGNVPKAHWDHVLDEMRWMHTDFRQETRWKRVSAYNLASACRAYVRAPLAERSAHTVRCRPPRQLSDEELARKLAGVQDGMEVEEEGDATLEESQSDAPQPRKADIDPSMTSEAPKAGASATADRPVVPIASAPEGAGKAGGSTGSEATPTTSQSSQASRTLAEASRANAQAQHVSKSMAFRNPVFDMTPVETVIDPLALAAAFDEAGTASEDTAVFLQRGLNELFPELPLYSDFIIANDATLARRAEDSSAWSGRLAHVTRLLETKPTLVSTLQPGRTRTSTGWSPALVDALEDSKEPFEGREAVPHTASTLFSARKPKDAAVGELLVKPQEVPNAEIRASTILWLPEEDALLLNLQRQYGLNWSLIAQVFNSSTNRPESDYRLAWDVYDRWDKLVGPGSKKLLPDGTEIVRPPPEWLPPVDRTGRPMPIIADGSKKKIRHAIIADAMKKVGKKRELYAAKQPATGFPRRINMAMHESHNIPPRPNWTPMEWTLYKAEQEAQKLRLRQQQQAQAQAAATMRQQQQAQQAQQQQQQQQQQSLAGLQQSRPPSSLPPQMAAQQAAAAAHASPTNSTAALPGSPSAAHNQIGSSQSPRNAPQQLNGHVSGQMPQLTADQLAALQARQRELLQAQAQAIAAQRAAAQQQASGA